MITRIEHGLRLGNITLRLIAGRNMKLLVARNDRGDLPHLLISWQNASNEFDLHLTRRNAGGAESYHPIASFDEAILKTAFESIGKKIFAIVAQNAKTLRKVRPGWLARKGYLILFLQKDDEERFIESLAPKRKHHGKLTHILDHEILAGTKIPQEMIESIYHPSKLHEIALLDHREPILAFSAKAKYKNRLISLMPHKNDRGTPKWVRTDELSKELMKSTEKLLLSALKEILPVNAWDQINIALQLNSLSIPSNPNIN